MIVYQAMKPASSMLRPRVAIPRTTRIAVGAISPNSPGVPRRTVMTGKDDSFSAIKSHQNDDNNDGKQTDFESILSSYASVDLRGRVSSPKTIRELEGMLEDGQLNLAPEYHRSYFWKPDKASRLVVTMLGERVVPGIVLHEVEPTKYDVVDGKQRLTSILSFYLAGKKPELHRKVFHDMMLEDRGAKEVTFKELCGLKDSHEALNGLTYDGLSVDRQNGFKSYGLPCTVIPHNTPEEIVFMCYEDINSGGEDLSKQQLRRAAYFSPFIKLLDQLAEDENFRYLRDPELMEKGKYEKAGDPKERDRELILRGIAWQSNWKSFKPPLVTFLNKKAGHFKTLDKSRDNKKKLEDELGVVEKEFKFVMKVCRAVFCGKGEVYCFREWKQDADGQWSWEKKISTKLYECFYSAICEIYHSDEKYAKEVAWVQNKTKLQQALKKLFEDKTLCLKYVSKSAFIKNRKAIVDAFSPVLDDFNGPTTASGGKFNAKDNELKQRLFKKQSGLCSICGETIDESRLDDGSYVHIDHIKPLSKGGAATEDNAGLAHAVCNRHKGANDTTVSST